jgi:hypothetical protein
MAVLACLQLEAFVLTAAMGLWVDVLFNTAIAGISEHTPLYKALFIFTTLVCIPNIPHPPTLMTYVASKVIASLDYHGIHLFQLPVRSVKYSNTR